MFSAKIVASDEEFSIAVLCAELGKSVAKPLSMIYHQIINAEIPCVC